MAYNLQISAAKGHPRAIAKIAGELTYLPNKPCPRGHMTWRYTKYGQCRDCVMEHKNKARKEGKYSDREKAYSRKYCKDNKLAIRLKPYNLTEEQYLSMLIEQNNKCKICLSDLIEGKFTHIDHCHDTNIVRGILCRGCNVGIAQLKHNPLILRAAADYCEFSKCPL